MTRAYEASWFSSSYSPEVPSEPARRWTIKTTADVRDWLRFLRQAEPDIYRSVNVAIDMLAEAGPGLGRPLVDTLQGSSIGNLKELRPRSGRDLAIRVLFVFDPLVAGGAARRRQQGWRLDAVVQEGDPDR
jgi:hypothetical protein